ncbi:MAG: DUF4332 domain-containing protein [Verrucomicrobiaceae bacterium]|nr:MAG: DUF4332 domain-containing protein [Verrucomicrobiaceae bacterium]
MSPLTAIPELPPEAIPLLEGAGIRTAEALVKLPVVEIHKRVEMSAWQKGRVQQAPSLATVQQWVRQAMAVPGALEDLPAALPAPSWDQADDIPEVIVLEHASLPEKNVYVPPSQRARRSAAGVPPPATVSRPSYASAPRAVEHLPTAVPLPSQVPSMEGGITPKQSPQQVLLEAATAPAAAALPSFNTFDEYKAGEIKVAPLSRVSLDAAVDPAEHARSMERLGSAESLSRWVQRGVVHPTPGALLVGALISLLWRLAVVGALAGLPWLILHSERPSDYRLPVAIAAGVLLVLGIAQLIVLTRSRCRVCSCHLFYSRNCVKNRKAHHIPLIGHTASLALHLLMFQWFRCMYCGTAIRLWMSKRDKQ